MHTWILTLLMCTCSNRHHYLHNSNHYLKGDALCRLAAKAGTAERILFSDVSDCPENCTSCTDPYICEVCDHGYTLTNRGRCVDLCIEGDSETNCAVGHCTVFDDTLCSKCAHEGDVPAAGVCNTGVTTCVKNSHGICISCESGHLLYRGGCYPSKSALAQSICATDNQIVVEGMLYCSLCNDESEAPINGHCTDEHSSYCDAESGQCINCVADGYFLFNGGCYNANEHPGSAICAEVRDGECTECGSHYPVTDGVCTYCPVDHCLLCENESCTQCQQGYVLRSSGRCVKLCSEGNGLQSCAIGHCTAFEGTLCTKCAYEEDVPVAGICTSGLTTCQKNSSQICISCEGEHLLYSGGCYATTGSYGLQICSIENQITIGGKVYCRKCNQKKEAPLNGECTEAAADHCDVRDGACTGCKTTGYFLFQGGCYTLASIPGNIICAEVSGTTCIKCRDGYGIHEGECSPCTIAHCLDCKSDVATCNACDPKYFFTGTACVACEGEHCAACRDNMCVDCTDKTECNACAIPNCVLCDPALTECLACQEAYEPDEDGFCTPLPASECPLSCLCADQDVPALCTSCKPGFIAAGVVSGDTCLSCALEVEHCGLCSYIPESDSIVCEECLDGYRMDDGLCEPCGNGCKSCPHRANKCAECFAETPYFNPALTECLSACPPNSVAATNKKCSCIHGYYSTLQGCEKCDESCDTCSGGEIDKCVTCRSGFFLASGSWKGQCIPCDLSSFSDGSVIGVEHCIDCRGVQENGDLIVVCKECDLGYTLKEEVCVLDDSGHEDCPSNCICTDVSPTCVSCQRGYFTLSTPSAENCVRCSSAISGCKTCTVEGSSLRRSTSKVTCTLCDDGKGLVEGTCHSCHVTCKTCNGDPELCSTCYNPAYKLSLRSDQCVPECPEFSEEQNGRCVCLLGYSISFNGLTCVKDSSACPSICTCAVGNICSGCADGYFTFDPSRTDAARCEPCSGDFCSSCGRVPNDAIFFGHTFSPGRRYAYRRSLESVNICIECADKQGCSACSIEGCNRCSASEHTECTECMPDYQLSQDKKSCIALVPICPLGCTCVPGTSTCNGCADGYFEVDPTDEASGRCMRCSIPTRYIPTRISGARRLERLLSIRGKRTDSISLQIVRDASWNGVAGCAMCTTPSSPGPAICTQCVQGKHLLVSGESTQCLDACPDGMRSINNVCFNCNDENCLRCDENLDSCVECRPGASPTLTPDTELVVCETVCPLGCVCEDAEDSSICTGCQSGYYEVSVLARFIMRLRKTDVHCKKCLANCMTCTDESTCLVCADGYILHQTDASCVEKCDQGYYNKQGQCAPCTGEHCTNCTSETTCTSCTDSSFLSNGKCVTCSTSCKTCGGGTENDCLTCPTGTVHSIGTGLGSCLQECSATAAGNCAVCNAIIDGTRYCSKCTPGEAPINGRCEPVSVARNVMCITSGDGTCESCSGGLFLFNGGCYATSRYPGSAVCTSSSDGLCTNCADGFTNTNGICSNCVLGCSSCSSTAASACTSCTEGFFPAFSGSQGVCKRCDDTTITDGYQGVQGCRICIAPQQAGTALCLDSSEAGNKSSLSAGAITGIAIAVIAVIGCAVGVLVWFLCCRRSKAV